MSKMTDTEAMDAISHLLGDAEDWSSPADFLEDIAGLVSLTGRPHPGICRPEETKTYMVIRMYASDAYDDEVIMRGLTLEEAQEHCNDPQTTASTATSAEAIERTTRRGPWFDGYTEED